jgi:predicted transposase YbfD/YdcC
MLQHSSIFAPFFIIEDPRGGNRSHPFESILFIIIVGVLCGADGFVQIERVAQARQKFIERFVPLPHGIPTHDTLSRVFQLMAPEQFRDAFITFIAQLLQVPKDEVVAIDGKTLRGALDRFSEQNARAHDQVHMVSAYAKNAGVVLAQLRSKAVFSEQQALQDLLSLIDLSGTTLTMDAVHCQKSTIKTAQQKGAHVLVALKQNQKRLYNAVHQAFESCSVNPVSLQTHEVNRGRTEQRTYQFLSASVLSQSFGFDGIQTFVRVTRIRSSRANALNTSHRSYYITTHPIAQAERIKALVRGRWCIENSLHHILDVAFDEDRCRVRTEHAAENLSRVRHIALNLLKLDTTEKVGLATRRLVAAADDNYLMHVLRLDNSHMRLP